MNIVFLLLVIQGLIGAFDTVYYHEYRACLPVMGREAADELYLHAARDFLYAAIFIGLPLFHWHGVAVVFLGLILLLEVILTMWDFIVETYIREPFGDVYAGERVTHGIMGIVYGAMLAFLIPRMGEWWELPSSFAYDPVDLPVFWFLLLISMGIGVTLSGLRDLYAAFELPMGHWPWSAYRVPESGGGIEEREAI